MTPPLSGTLSFNAPPVNEDQLDNGMKVLHIYQDELPMAQFSIRIKGGMFLDDPEKVGTAALLDNMLMEGTANKTSQELEEAIGQLGARINVFASKEYITISGNSLAKNYDKVMGLVEEILFEPRWDATEFERVKKSALNSIQQSAANPNAIASNVFNKVLYGENHILAYPVYGTAETVSNITLEDVKAYYEKNFSPSLAAFHFVGALDESAVMASLDRLKTWEAKDVTFPEYEIASADEGSRIYFVDYPDAKQSVINIGSISMNGDNEDFSTAQVANYRLGSGSGSILFKELRLEKGYTYGAYSGFSRNMNGAPFTAASSVRSNVTKESVDLFKDILDNYGDNFTAEDMENTRTAILRSNTQSFETLGGLVGILQNISTYNLPKDYIKREEEKLKSMTAEDAKKIIEEYMNPDELLYVVVGDGKTQLNLLNNTGLGKPIVVNPADQKLEIKKK